MAKIAVIGTGYVGLATGSCLPSRVTAVGLGLDPRTGQDTLDASSGWGSCFPKDTRALVSIASKSGYDYQLVRGVGR